MEQGLNCYKFGTKNNWRRWQWNRIVERLTVKTSKALVVYLVGPDDIDRKIAKSKGFKNHNLIAVDLNEQNIDKIKANKNLGICTDLNFLLLGWKGEPKIDVVIADFCCGLTTPIMQSFIYNLIFSEALNNECVVSINFMRGRDKWATKLKEMYEGEISDTKHRGKMFYDYFMDQYWAALNALKDIKREINSFEEWQDFTEKNVVHRYGNNNWYNIPDEIRHKELEEMARFQLYYSCPTYWNYQSESSNIYMDSLVFKIKRINNGEFHIDHVIKHQIAALKAWRTIRMNGG